MNKPKSPRLRFPNIGKELTSNSLNELSLLVTSGSRDWAQFYSTSGAKFIRMTNLRRGSPVLDLEELKYVCVPKTSRDGFRTKLEYGDILVSITAELGKIGLVSKDIGDAYINQHVALVRPKKSDLCGFLAHYLTAPQTHKRLNRLNDSGAKSGLNLSTLKAFPVHSPETDECRKIADFLTSIDTKISHLAEKHRLLKEYKKGVMQQIFSQKIRFKDDVCNAFPDWKDKSFGEFLTLDLRKVEKPKDNFLALGVRSHVKGVFHKPDFDPSAIAMEELYVVKENDLVLSITFAWEGAIAIANKHDEGGLVSHRFPTYTFDKQQVIPEFFKYVIPNLRLRYLLGNISPGGAGRNRVLNKKDFLKLTWAIPSVKEQQKISKFLQSLDQKIEAVEEQIEQTKQFKKGLLQQMFV